MSSENALLQQQLIQSSDLTTADILEREVKNKSKQGGGLKGLDGVFHHERRDEGDGRSIADSSSSSYKGGGGGGTHQFRGYDKLNNSINRLSLQKMRTKQN